jgi:hypothetical protein
MVHTLEGQVHGVNFLKNGFAAGSVYCYFMICDLKWSAKQQLVSFPR